MDKGRKHIALFYTKSYDEATSLVIYIQNVIKGFDTVNDSEKPKITLFYNQKSNLNEVEQIGYPYLDYHELKIVERPFYQKVLNKLYRAVKGRNLYSIYNTDELSFDAIYPVWSDVSGIKSKETFFWCIDFIANRYPNYFSRSELQTFKNSTEKAAKIHDNLVFSSYDAFNDFKQMIPNYKVTPHILHFPSIFVLEEEEKSSLLKRYNLRNNFFITPNQFWPHKNHIIVLKALKRLLETGIKDFDVVFTGKTTSYRDNDYHDNMVKFIEKNGLSGNVKILGFIPRQDQLNLMNYSLSIIQPSLFEGWSTLVEEAKGLNKHVILSDIPLHREQIEQGCDFFQIDDDLALSDYMKMYLNEPPTIYNHNYQNKIMEFGADLYKIFIKK